MGGHSGTNTRPSYKSKYFDPTQTYYEDSIGPTATIKEIYAHVMLENQATLTAAADGWTAMSRQLAGIKADLDAQQNKLTPKWSSDAATLYFDQMDLSSGSLTEWQNVASDNATAMRTLSKEVERLKTKMAKLWKQFDADVKDAKSRLDHSWWLRKAQDLHDWASGEGDFDYYVEKYTKLANSEVVNPLNQAYTDAFNAVATGTVFGGPTNSIAASQQQIAEAMGLSVPTVPGVPGGSPPAPPAAPPIPPPPALSQAFAPPAPGPLPASPPAPIAPRTRSAVPPPTALRPPSTVAPPDEPTMPAMPAMPNLPETVRAPAFPSVPTLPVEDGPAAPARGVSSPAQLTGRPGAPGTPGEPEPPSRPAMPRPTLRGRGGGTPGEPTEPPSLRNPGSRLSGRRRGGNGEPAEPRPGRPVSEEPETPSPGRGGPALPGRTARRGTPPEEPGGRNRLPRLEAPRTLQGMRDTRPRFRPGSVEAEEPAMQRVRALEGRLAAEPTESTPEPLRPDLAGRGRGPAQPQLRERSMPKSEAPAVDFVGDSGLFGAEDATPSVIDRPEEVKPVVPERSALRPGV